jgi:hypothetical protein
LSGFSASHTSKLTRTAKNYAQLDPQYGRPVPDENLAERSLEQFAERALLVAKQSILMVHESPRRSPAAQVMTVPTTVPTR